MNAVSCAYVDASDRQTLCEQIMKRADSRLMDAGFWEAFDGARAEMRETWRVLQLNNARKRKRADPPRPRYPNARKKTPVSCGESINSDMANASRGNVLVPGFIVKDEIMDPVQKSFGLQFVNSSVNDFVERESLEGGGPSSSLLVDDKAVKPALNLIWLNPIDDVSIEVPLKKAIEAGVVDEDPVRNILSSNGLCSFVNEDCVTKPLTNPSAPGPIINSDFVNIFLSKSLTTPLAPAPIINLDFVNVFPSNFSETGSFKKTDTSALRRDLTDEEDYDCLFEEEEEDGPHAMPRAGLDQHSTYQREFILAIELGI